MPRSTLSDKQHLRKCSVCGQLFYYTPKKHHFTTASDFVCSEKCMATHKEEGTEMPAWMQRLNRLAPDGRSYRKKVRYS